MRGAVSGRDSLCPDPQLWQRMPAHPPGTVHAVGVRAGCCWLCVSSGAPSADSQGSQGGDCGVRVVGRSVERVRQEYLELDRRRDQHQQGHRRSRGRRLCRGGAPRNAYGASPTRWVSRTTAPGTRLSPRPRPLDWTSSSRAIAKRLARPRPSRAADPVEGWRTVHPLDGSSEAVPKARPQVG